MSDCQTVDLSPAELNIVGFKSGTLAYLLELEEEQDDGTWEPLDLTGYTGIELVAYDQDPAAPLDVYDEAHGTLVVDAAAGKIQVQVPRATVEAYTWFTASQFLRATDPAGTTAALTGGSLTFTFAPTRATGQGAC